ncbi:MAG: hypothetical protein ACRDZX_14235, partial [Acidimicrobiales bacterium]
RPRWGRRRRGRGLWRAPGGAPWSGLGAFLPAGWRGTAAVATVATLLNWPGWNETRTSLDLSWQAGLTVAFTHHLQWGPGLDFTYGPYGFAGFIEPFYRSTAVIASIYVFIVTWALAALLVAGLRRYWGLAAAGVVAWAVVGVCWAVFRSADVVTATGLGLALVLVKARRDTARYFLAGSLGVLAGFSLLVKPNSGTVLIGMAVVAVAGTDGPRRERLRVAGLGAAGLVSSFAAAWAGASQSFANIPSFARGTVSLALGYSTAMEGRVGDHALMWWALAIGALAAVAVAAGLGHASGRHRAAVALIFAGWLWATAKEGFVAGNHYPVYFRLLLAGVALACTLRPPPRLYAAALGLAACITLATAHLPALNPWRSLRALGTEVADLADGGRFTHVAAATRAEGAKAAPLSAGTLAMLRGHTVAVEPWQDIVAWSDTKVRWDPEPVVQDYSAFTTYTDRLDADFLSSPGAPQRVLYRWSRFAFAYRDPWMDPPATTEALFCHYTQIASAGKWQVLRRAPDRCGHPVTLETALVHFGERVRVPKAPGKMVVASFSFSSPLLAALEGVALKPPEMHLVTWGRDRRRVTYRFLPGTAADEHVVNTPRALGYSPRARPGHVSQIELEGGGWAKGQGNLVVRFSALSMSP